MKLPIYMDYHATTPVDARVMEAMTPYFVEFFGNPSSRSHPFGWQAAEAVEEARKKVATLIGAKPREIFFTSGATESDNLALKGAAWMHRERGAHIITSAIEHKAILESCHGLEKQGFEVTTLAVDRHGLVDPADVERAITSRTFLITVMFANNEIGTIEPVEEIGRIARSRGVLFHTDAAQAVGKVPVDVEKTNIDLLSLTAHKMYGPKGIGALYVRGENPRGVLAPLMHGGGQESGLRSGTLNVPGIVGLGETCRICQLEMPAESERMRRLSGRLKEGILSELDGVYLNGHETRRLPQNVNLSFGYVEGETLLMSLRDIAVSSGAACASEGVKGSHVLEAIGLREDLVQSSIRFGLGRFTTEEEVSYVKQRVVETVQRLREGSPAYAAKPAGAGK